jgi:UDP:flavonoid glycosyltransferase YjiC (YdhE family)
VHCFVPGASKQLATRLEKRGINVSTLPLKLKGLLAGANAIVSYGSHGYIAAALMAGVPCVVLPIDVEKAALGRRIAQLHAGIAVSVNRAGRQLRPALEAILGDARYLAAASAFAQRYAAHRTEGLPTRITAAISGIAIDS